MSSVAIEKLKELVNPSLLLTALGFKVFYDNQDEIRAQCLLHGGDNRTAFCFRKSSRRFYCFTHACETDESGDVNNDIVSLVMKARKCSFMDAVRFLSELTGYNVDLDSIDPVEETKLNHLKEKNKFIKGVLGRKAQLPEIPEDIVKSYISSGAEYFIKLGYPKHLIDMYELGTMVDEYGVTRGTIPVRDENGRLVSISGRRVDGDEEPRYKLLKEFKKRKVLYNLNNVIPIRDEHKGVVIVVEGFKALWHVVLSGFPNVVAVMGKVIRPEQRNLLVKSGFSCSILLLDGDEAGRDGTEKSLMLLEGKMETRPIYLPHKISPDDVSLDDIHDLIISFIR